MQMLAYWITITTTFKICRMSFQMLLCECCVLPMIYSQQNSMEDDFLSLMSTYYDMTPDRITNVYFDGVYAFLDF